MNLYEKARLTGCEELHIVRSQLPFDSNPIRTIDIHESHDRVCIHAMWFDAKGESVSLGHIGITSTPDSTVLWRRSPPAVPIAIRKSWVTEDMRKAWAHVNEKTT